MTAHATVTTYHGKGAKLTIPELDANFEGLAAAVNAGLDAIEALQAAAANARGDVSATTILLAAGASAYLDVPLGKAYALLATSTDFPARVRVYVTNAHRAADAARAVGTMPANDHGMVAEDLTALGYLKTRQSPIPVGANLEDVPTSTAFVTVTNRDVVSRAITVTFSRLVLES